MHPTTLYRLALLTTIVNVICLAAYLDADRKLRNAASEPAPKAEQMQVHKNLGLAKKSKKAPIKKAKLHELPLGGRQLLPDYLLVALYGSPDSPALGLLGEQPLPQAILRAKQLAAEYQPYSSAKVMPALEIIATVASEGPTIDNDYSQEVDINVLRTWIEAAEKENIYVILDLQPGRSDFLSQAKMHEELLKYPNVGLALDPEWRLKPDQVHLVQIGSVDAAEVNQVGTWLADLTKKHNLPQKLFLLHQFRLDMINNSQTIDTSRPELAYLVQMDGNGDQGQKQDTWNVVTSSYPQPMNFGWKNFIDEDSPMLSPAETMTKTPTFLLV